MKLKSIFIIINLSMLTGACSSFYVLKQGVNQFKMLAGAEDIGIVLRSPNLNDNARNKLMLIQELRQYSKDVLKFETAKNYKNINLDWQKKIYNVSGSEKTMFKPYTWWFPIIGHVPYKGFFDLDDAKAEEERLKKLGFDTSLRAVGGYSTLGYFSDPVWPSMLDLEEEALTELIIHELAHATFYLPNQTNFNESFANFVGKLGALQFVANKHGLNSEKYNNILEYQNKIDGYNLFFKQLFDELDALYKSLQSFEDKKLNKEIILKKAQINYDKFAASNGLRDLDWAMINNAYLMSFKRYNFDDESFQELYRLVGKNIPALVDALKNNVSQKDPFTDLKNYLQKRKGAQ